MSKSTYSLQRVRVALLTVVVLLGATSAASAQTYNIIDLGTLGGASSAAFALNDLGAVAGAATQMDATYHGLYWDGSGTDVAPLAGEVNCFAFAVNAGGQVAAMSFNLGDVQSHGLIWQGGVTTSIAGLQPRGISSAGTPVGYVAVQDPSYGWVDHAAYWQAGSAQDIGTLGGHWSYAYGVSDSNQIVGMSFLSDDITRRAALWQAGVWHDLGTLGGVNSQAYAINNANQVVGYADTGAGEAHACVFLVNASGGVVSRTDLGTLGGGYSYAYGINDAGRVVGTSNAAAFLWQGGVITDLNTRLPANSDWRLEQAWDINNTGEIVGAGYHFGQPRAFLLSPSMLGDMNCDGVVNNQDIDGFILALFNAAGYAAAYPNCNILNGDFNGDGAVNNQDIDGFIQALFGH